MEKSNYHHGALKEELIEKGLYLIQTEGMKGLTMRHVARLCEVSPTAAYKHFENKEELLKAITQVIAEEFYEVLTNSMKDKKGNDAMIAVGKAYVTYLLSHPVEGELLFKGENKIKISFQNGKFYYEENSPFQPFCQQAEEYLKSFVPDEQIRGYKILQMWSEVHGYAELFSNQIVATQEDLGEIIVRMLEAEHVVCSLE